MKKSIDLTEGSVVGKVVLFALPLFFASFIQLLYNTVDLIYIGRALGANASAAVGSSSMLVTCLVGLFSGIGLGASVILARLYGGREEARVKKTIQTGYSLALVSGIAVMILGWLLAPGFIDLIHTPEEIRADSVLYLRIYFYSVFFLVTFNINSGMIRAFGNSRSPMVYQLIGGLVNVVADAFFIYGLHMGVDGVAWATFFSQGIPSVLSFICLIRGLPQGYGLNWRNFQLDLSVMKEVFRVGIPAGLQTLVIALSNVVAQYHINSLGTQSISAFTAYFKIELMIYFPIVAVGQAVTVFVGQNLGAKQFGRIRSGVRACLLLNMGLTLAISFLMLFAGTYAFGIFVKDRLVIEQGLKIIGVTFPLYFIYAILETYGDAIRGWGNSTTPMLIIMINICLIRSILLFAFVPGHPSVVTIALTYPVTWSLTAIGLALYYRFGQVTRIS